VNEIPMSSLNYKEYEIVSKWFINKEWFVWVKKE
jgi:hypothetical protein